MRETDQGIRTKFSVFPRLPALQGQGRQCTRFEETPEVKWSNHSLFFKFQQNLFQHAKMKTDLESAYLGDDRAYSHSESQSIATWSMRMSGEALSPPWVILLLREMCQEHALYVGSKVEKNSPRLETSVAFCLRQGWWFLKLYSLEQPMRRTRS